MVGVRSTGRIVVRMCALWMFVALLTSGRASAQDRGGFTALVDIGAGVQHDAAIDETAAGTAGLGFGIGRFLTRDVGLLFRVAGTTVNYDLEAAGEYGQSSGFVGPSVQYWLSDRFNIEAGAGWGFWSAASDEDETGLGLILGAGVTLFNRGKHNLQLGVQYSPAFTDPATVHNIGLTFGYQFL
jgi:hypothetical protein